MPVARILIVSHHFEPRGSAEALCSTRAARSLQAHGHVVHVVTATAVNAGPGYGWAPLHGLEVERITLPPPAARLSVPWRVWRRAERVAPWLEWLPDPFIGWFRKRKSAILSAAKKFAPDVIYSRATPVTSHFVARWLRGRLRLPWVAHFSDPWIGNPYTPMSRLSLPVHRRWERLVLEQADRIVFTTEVAAAQTAQRYSGRIRRKVHVIPHAIPEDIAPGSAERAEGGPLLAHVGKLYGDRSPEPLLRALSALRRQGAVPGTTRLVLVGWMEPHYIQAITTHGLADITTITGQVSYEASLDWMRRADILVSIDAASDAASPFVPSKIMDYLAFRVPILNVTSPGSASAGLMEEVGGHNMLIGDDAGSSRTLASLLAASPSSCGALAPRGERLLRYGGVAVGNALDSLVRELLPVSS